MNLAQLGQVRLSSISRASDMWHLYVDIAQQ